MPDLFKQKNSYDNEGNLYTNNATQFLKATLTITLGGTGASKIIPNMYDGNSATYCAILAAVAGTGTAHWKFASKPKFKNVIATCTVDKVAHNITAYLEGSDDDSAWTELDSVVFTADGTKSLIKADVNYRYLRVRLVCAGDCTAGIADIMGTT